MAEHISQFADMTPDQFIDELLSLENIKVWSLIVTLFGDLGRDQPVSLTGKELRDLLGPTGIKPEAIRVALHRLKKDGWMTSAKDGRQSIYRLSKDGLKQTQLAYDDVYRVDTKYPDGWALYFQHDEEGEHSRGGIALGKNLLFAPVETVNNDQFSMRLDFDAETAPAWFLRRVVPGSVLSIAEQYASIVENLENVSKQCKPREMATIRLLVLHHWRKMALRDNTWCHMWMFPKGAFGRSHQIISSFLNEHPVKLFEPG